MSALTPEEEAELRALGARMTAADYDTLEAKLIIHAACLGWTGEPLQQPAHVVLAIARQVIAERAPASTSLWTSTLRREGVS